jgi:SAM-dependent methyltransferase
MTELDATGPNAGQITYWNESAGPMWVAQQAALDAQIRPFGLKAMEALAPTQGERLIDVGCGCGDTTLELARRVGSAGAVLGADVSAPMLGLARQRAAEAGLSQASFVQADAQTHAFAPADGVFSRFGVMFFADPDAAFANLRRALRPGGRLAFVCWRSLAENPWVAVPMAAVSSVAPAPATPPAPGAPGPFSLGSRDRLQGVLTAAGFADISLAEFDHRMSMGDLDAAVEAGLSRGPASAMAREHPELRDRFAAAVRGAMAPHLTGDGVLLDSAAWIVRATA